MANSNELKQIGADFKAKLKSGAPWKAALYDEWDDVELARGLLPILIVKKKALTLALWRATYLAVWGKMCLTLLLAFLIPLPMPT